MVQTLQQLQHTYLAQDMKQPVMTQADKIHSWQLHEISYTGVDAACSLVSVTDHGRIEPRTSTWPATPPNTLDLVLLNLTLHVRETIF